MVLDVAEPEAEELLQAATGPELAIGDLKAMSMT